MNESKSIYPKTAVNRILDFFGNVVKHIKKYCRHLLYKCREYIKRGGYLAIVAIAIFIWIYIPDKVNYTIAIIFSVIIFGKIFARLIATTYFLAVDFNKIEISLYEISDIALRSYKILDRDHKIATLEHWFNTDFGRLYLVDNIDVGSRTMILNPVCSSIEFAKNYAELYDEIIKKANTYLNETIMLKDQLKHETKVEAVKLLESLTERGKKEHGEIRKD